MCEIGIGKCKRGAGGGGCVYSQSHSPVAMLPHRTCFVVSLDSFVDFACMKLCGMRSIFV